MPAPGPSPTISAQPPSVPSDKPVGWLGNSYPAHRELRRAPPGCAEIDPARPARAATGRAPGSRWPHPAASAPPYRYGSTLARRQAQPAPPHSRPTHIPLHPGQPMLAHPAHLARSDPGTDWRRPWAAHTPAPAEPPASSLPSRRAWPPASRSVPLGPAAAGPLCRAPGSARCAPECAPRRRCPAKPRISRGDRSPPRRRFALPARRRGPSRDSPRRCQGRCPINPSDKSWLHPDGPLSSGRAPAPTGSGCYAIWITRPGTVL